MAVGGITPEGVGLQFQMTEVWRQVVTEPGILASSWGRVLIPPRYTPMSNGGYRLHTPKPTFGIQARSKKGAAHSYLHVMVYRSDAHRRQTPRKVHQLVCEAFHGPRPSDADVVIHNDEDGLNNRPENLRWGTQKENLNMPAFLEYCRIRNGQVALRGGSPAAITALSPSPARTET